MSISLTIKAIPRSEQYSPRTAAAWMIASANPEDWLQEILKWKLPQSPLVYSIRLYPIPRSASDLRITGVLVTLPKEIEPQQRPFAAPFAHLGHRIYLPADSDISPALLDNELEQLNRFDLLLLHPSLGTIGFDAQDSRSVQDLFAHFTRLEMDWETAFPGLTSVKKIQSISLVLPPNILQSPQENNDPSSGGGPNPTRIPSNPKAQSPNPASKPPKWLPSRLSSWLQSITPQGPSPTDKRDESIQKLLDQLQSDPDEALKKAISLGMSSANRGVAPPGGNLTPRNVNFDIRQLGGGGLADFWDLKPQQAALLRQHYIRLASRERSLGRHRRAAYIYASLLGDLNNAALMLQEGHFYQEAARLYKDLLSDPLRAADCFEKAGLFSEAIAIYQEMKLWEKLAQLYEKMEQPELARQALYSWVAQLRNVGDLLLAADVLFDRLHVPNEALHLLESAWPHHRQAWLSVTRALQWRASHGELDEAAALLKRMGAKVYPEHTLASFISVLIETKKIFADERIRSLAEDLGRSHVAKYLSQNNSSHEQHKIISSLIGLAKDDHLLRRDALRFLEQRQNRAKSVTQAMGKQREHIIQPGGPIELLNQFRLKSDPNAPNEIWFQICAFNSYFVVLSYKDSAASHPTQLKLTRSTFKGGVDTFLIPVPTSNRILLANHSSSLSDLLFVHPLPKPSLNPVLKQTDTFPKLTELIGSFIGESPTLLTATFSTAGDLWTLHLTSSGLTLTAYQTNGSLLCNLSLDRLLPLTTIYSIIQNRGPFAHASLSVMDKFIAFSFANHLYTWETNRALAPDQFVHYQVAEPITSIVAGPRWARPHLALLQETRMSIIWPGEPSGELQTVVENLSNPVACFTHDGVLVVLDDNSGQIFDCDTRGTRSQASFKLIGPAPIAVIPGSDTRHFATLSKGGNIQLFQYNSAFKKRA